METIDFPTRAALVSALLHARENGIEVQVVGNGLTLEYPADYGAGQAGGEEAVEDVLQSPPEPLAPAGQGASTPVPTPEAPEGSQRPVIGEGGILRGEKAEDEDDIIGAPASIDISSLNWQQIKVGLEDGSFTREQVLDAELAGKNRKGVLSLVMEE